MGIQILKETAHRRLNWHLYSAGCYMYCGLQGAKLNGPENEEFGRNSNTCKYVQLVFIVQSCCEDCLVVSNRTNDKINAL